MAVFPRKHKSNTSWAEGATMTLLRHTSVSDVDLFLESTNPDADIGPSPAIAALIQPAEADAPMDSNDRLPVSFPFDSSDMDIDMMDKIQETPTNGTSPTATVTQAGATDIAPLLNQLNAVFGDMARRLQAEEGRRRMLEQQVVVAASNARAYETFKQSLREADAGVSSSDLEGIQRILTALTQDPNHIMVLASVAQQANTLLAIVNAYAKLRNAQ